jgi:hypothetical protein
MRREKTHDSAGVQSTRFQSAEPQSGSALIAAWHSAMADERSSHRRVTGRFVE